MTGLAPPLERVILELTKLPGVGRKTAQRLALHLLQVPREDATALGESILELRELVHACNDCFNLTDREQCPICAEWFLPYASDRFCSDPCKAAAKLRAKRPRFGSKGM